MLNVFPGLLIPFLAPTLLRLAVALGFGFTAWAHFARRREVKSVWLWPAIVGEVAVTVSLFLGTFTQVAALVALVLCIGFAVYAKKCPRAVPMCRGEYILLAIISLSLILSGAGAFAQDLPL